MTTKLRFWMEKQGVQYSVELDCAPTSRQWVRAFGVMETADHQAHAQGVWLFARRWPGTADSPGIIEWAFRQANSLVRRDGTGFCGALRYENLGVDLICDAGESLELYSPPRHGQHCAGPSAQLVDPTEGPHEFPARRGFARRGIIVALGANAPGQWNRIAGYAWVNFAARRLAFGAARERLPVRPWQDPYKAKADQLQAAVESGAAVYVPGVAQNESALADVRRPAMGPYLLDGDSQPGAVAGYKITLCPGAEQSPHALRLASLQHECTVPRIAYCHDLDTGEPIDPGEWATNALSQGQLRSGDPNPAYRSTKELLAFMVGNYYTYRIRQADSVSCPYADDLEAYWPHDGEHQVRAEDDAMQLVGWAGDALAADDLVCMRRSYAHCDFQLRADDKLTPSYPGEWVPPSLSRVRAEVFGSPGHGHPRVERTFGWMLGIGAWASSLGDALAVPWTRALLDVLLAAADACAIGTREYHAPYMPSNVQGCQHFHWAICLNQAIVAARALGYRVPEVVGLAWAWRQQVCENPAMPPQPRAGTPTAYGPPKWIWRVVGPTELAPPLTLANSSSATAPDGFQEHVLAALGREAQSRLDWADTSGASAALQAGLGIGSPATSLAAKVAAMRAGAHDLSQEASYLAAAEALGL